MRRGEVGKPPTPAALLPNRTGESVAHTYRYPLLRVAHGGLSVLGVFPGIDLVIHKEEIVYSSTYAPRIFHFNEAVAKWSALSLPAR